MNAEQRGKVRGGRDMLKEAAKQFRLNADSGHAAMCEKHARALDDILPEHCRYSFYEYHGKIRTIAERRKA